MKATLILALNVLAVTVLSSCSSVSVSPRRLVVEQKWVVSTRLSDSLHNRVAHRMSPVTYKSLLIQGNGIDGIAAYKQDSGVQAWKLPIEGGVEGGAALKGDVIYFGANNAQFYAVHADTGAVKWVYPLAAEVLSAPLLTEDSVYFSVGNNSVYALDLEAGKLRWVYKRDDPQSQSIRGGSRPVIFEKNLLVGSSDGSLLALSTESGQLVWEKRLNNNKRFRDVDSTPVLDGSRVYVSSYDGALFCLNAQDGQIIWKLDEGGFNEVTLDGEKLYYSTSNGKILALEKASGKLIWQYNLKKGGVGSKPLLHKGTLIVADSTGPVVFLTATSGQLVSSFSSGRGAMSNPVMVDPDQVAFISNEALLFMLKMTWQKEIHFWPWQKM